MKEITNTRTDILATASTLINGDRQQDYGPPSENFGNIARLWRAYLTSRGNMIHNLDSADVAYLMALLKLARASGTNTTFDTVADMAGYVALAGELQGVRKG